MILPARPGQMSQRLRELAISEVPAEVINGKPLRCVVSAPVAFVIDETTYCAGYKHVAVLPARTTIHTLRPGVTATAQILAVRGEE